MPRSQERRVSRKTKGGLRESSLGMTKSRTMFKSNSFSGGMWPSGSAGGSGGKKVEAVFSRGLVVKGVRNKSVN